MELDTRLAEFLSLQEDLESYRLKLQDEKEKVSDLEEKLVQECANKPVFLYAIILTFQRINL